MKRNGWKRMASITILVVSLSSLLAMSEDQGFDVIYEGPVQSDGTMGSSPSLQINLTLYGNAGFAAAGAFWATAGGKAELDLGGFSVHADLSAGTSGFQALLGAATRLLGFRVAGDITLTPGSTPVIDLRGWGSFGAIRLTGNARLAGTATSLSLGASTDFGGYGVSGNLGISGGALTTASVGANTDLGGLSLSASGGWAGGRLNVGGGLGLQLGPVNLAANAGYDSTLGLNAMASGAVGFDTFEMTAVGLYDNTGVGLETTGELLLGQTTLSFMGRFSGGSMSIEVGGGIPFGSVQTSFSVAIDNQTGFAWAEVGFELPL